MKATVIGYLRPHHSPNSYERFHRWRWLPFFVLIALLSATLSYAQQAVPFAPAATSATADGLLRDIDLSRRANFSEADQAALSVRVIDHRSLAVPGLDASSFDLLVNGTARSPVTVSRQTAGDLSIPLVLIMFPPNQRRVHELGIKDINAYLSTLAPVIEWKVGIFDSDGTATEFTQNRDKLIAQMSQIAKKNEPLMYAAFGSPTAGGWLDKAQYAVAQMRLYGGPKFILFLNPSHDEMPDEGGLALANNGPESLINIALAANVHLYIANIAGSGFSSSLADAPSGTTPQQPGFRNFDSQSQLQVTQTQGPGASVSVMQIAAAKTMGDFANSIPLIAGKIERDAEAMYVIRFDLTPLDRNEQTLQVRVRTRNKSYTAIMLDLVPWGPKTDELQRNQVRMAALWERTSHPVPSPNLTINQHVDYFPTLGGKRPILPLSATLTWESTNKEAPNIHVAEFLEQTQFDVPVMLRELDVRWVDGRIAWSHLQDIRPGDFDWRIVALDDAGNVLATSDERVRVGLPETSGIAMSSLVLSTQCDPSQQGGGLRQRPTNGKETTDATRPLTNPLATASCVLKPLAGEDVSLNSKIIALVRIYPSGKLDKLPPEKWSCIFLVKDKGGKPELTLPVLFSTDANGGFVAYATIPLATTGTREISARVQGAGANSTFVKTRVMKVSRSKDNPA